MTTLVLSAHLDDAVLSCGGRLGPGHTVATLFAGLPPASCPLGLWDASTGAHDSHERVLERREEDRCALGLLGAQGHWLPFLDSQYRETEVDPAEASAALAPLVMAAAALWLPAAIGSHPDHVLTRTIGLHLAENAGIPVQLYADLPYAFLDGWPADLADGWSVQRSDPESAWPAEATLAREVADLYPTSMSARTAYLRRRVHRLDPPAVQRKREAVQAYITQVPLLDEHCEGRIGLGEDLAIEVEWAFGQPAEPSPGDASASAG